MTKAIRFHSAGGPEVMKFEEVTVGKPGPGEGRLGPTAVAVNDSDVDQRAGLYPRARPAVPGNEAAGVVEEVGAGVTHVKVGDHVAYAGAIGAYAEGRNVPAERLVKLPAGISDEIAASMLLKGMTAEYLVRRTYPVKKGETILVHAAAGGVGLILCQWAKHIGATVIGTVGSDEKAKLARANGCDHAIVYTREDFVARVKEITGGKGLPVIYDSVGKDTFMKSLLCLRPRGLMVSFGQASGKVDPIDVGILAAHGSLFLTRASLAAYTATRAELEESAGALFDLVQKKTITISLNHRFALKDAAEAHRALESRKTTGSIVLMP